MLNRLPFRDVAVKYMFKIKAKNKLKIRYTDTDEP